MPDWLAELTVEAYTFLVALFCAIIRFCQNLWYKVKTASKDLISSILNGASIVPFTLMVFCLFSDKALNLATSSKLSMAIAGAVGLVFVLGETLSPSNIQSSKPVGASKPENDSSYDGQVAVRDLNQALSEISTKSTAMDESVKISS